MNSFVIVKPYSRFPDETCPRCKSPMALTDTRPVMLTHDFYHARYCCQQCGEEVLRTLKREFETA